jgi:glycosyltransferase involved in cell wall biosynthesis
MKKIILYIHHSANAGGAPRSLKLLLDRISTDDIYQAEVMIIKKGISAEILKTPNVKSFFSPGLRPFHGSEVSGGHWKLQILNVLGVVSTIINISKYYKKGKYDIVHLNSTCLCVVGMMIKLLDRKVKIISHVREPLLDNISGKIIKYLTSKVSDHIIAISNYDLKTVSIVERNTTVCHNYVNVNHYKYNKVTNLSSPLVVGYFARLDSKNGIVEFIDIAQMLRQKSDKFKFVVYGVTNLEEPNIKQAIDETKDFIEFNMMTHDVVKSMSSIDILLALFTKPHFSRSVVEAAALQIPSIIYDVGSINELVDNEKSGYVCRLCDKAEVIERLLEIELNRTELNRLGINARSNVLNHFSEKNVEKVIDVYNSLI